MKTKQVLAVMITSLFLLYGCSNSDDGVEGLASKASEYKGSSEIHREYPKEKREVMETFGAIGATITAGAGTGYDSEYMDQLISFHAYGDKFVEFNNGKVYDSAGNEHNERFTFGVALDEGGVKKFAALPGTMKVAVYFGNVANVTFISDFLLKFDGVVDPVKVNSLITLLFIKTNDGWKMVHEHHSPMGGSANKSAIASKEFLSKSASRFKSSEISEPYPNEQIEVMKTFGEIGIAISKGAGMGYDSEYMDQLISFHAYGRKFTEFNDGKLFDSAGNEHNERSLFGETVDVGGVQKFGALNDDIKIAVYFGNVANVTFISDFELIIDGDVHYINNLITLLFVKTKGKWKMVHEHHSPANL